MRELDRGHHAALVRHGVEALREKLVDLKGSCLERRAIAEEAARRELDVAEGEAVEVRRRQQLAKLVGAPLEEREHPALEALGRAAP